MRVLLSAFMVFILVFLIAVFILSGVGERFFISSADKSEGVSLLREVSVTRAGAVAPGYTVKLEGLDGTPSLNLHLAPVSSLYNLGLMYDSLSKLEAGSRVKVEWCSTFISGIVITGINGVSVIKPVAGSVFIIWIALTVIGLAMLAFVATITVYSFRKPMS